MTLLKLFQQGNHLYYYRFEISDKAFYPKLFFFAFGFKIYIGI